MTMVGDEQVYLTRKVCGQPPDTTTFLTSYNPMTQAFVIYLESELKPRQRSTKRPSAGYG
jgi:hypothetical protein